MNRIKSPYVKQLMAFAILIAWVAGLAWFDAHLIVDMPNPRAFNVYMEVLFVTLLLIGVAVVYLIDERKLKQHELYPQDFIEQDEREEQLTARATRRSFVIMDFILWVGSLSAVVLASVLDSGPDSGALKLLGVTFLALYIIMHTVFLLSLRRS